MYDSRIDLCERIHTFEAPGAKKASQKAREQLGAPFASWSTSAPRGGAPLRNVSTVCQIDVDIPDVIAAELKECIMQMKDHLYHECNIQLMKGTFYFKYDKHDHLYLIHAAGLQAQNLNDISNSQA